MARVSLIKSGLPVAPSVSRAARAGHRFSPARGVAAPRRRARLTVKGRVAQRPGRRRRRDEGAPLTVSLGAVSCAAPHPLNIARPPSPWTPRPLSLPYPRHLARVPTEPHPSSLPSGSSGNDIRPGRSSRRACEIFCGQKGIDGGQDQGAGWGGAGAEVAADGGVLEV